MASFELRIEKAVENLVIPGAVLVADRADGTFRYEKAFGVRSLTTKKPMEIDTTMWLASCTKLMATLAAMQCVESGQLELDADVTTILPELKGREILTGFDEKTGEPILKPNAKTITLRQLLTHQSGMGYDVFNPLLHQYRNWQKREFGMKVSFQDRTVPEANDFPLLFAPGESWEYSGGCDWAGVMVERVNGNITLEEYLKKNVWGPLEMNLTTFYPYKNPEVKSRLADIAWREGGVTMFGTADSPNSKVIPSDDTIWNPETKHPYGGAGCYGSCPDYAKILHSLCANDGKLLKPATVDEMFKSQLSAEAKAALAARRQIVEVNVMFGDIPQDVEVDWGIGGMKNLKGYPGRSEGTMSWGGYPNLHWFVDRAAGLSGILGTQINQPGDLKVVEINNAWSEELYKKAGVQEKL